MVGVNDELPYAAIVASAHGMQNKGFMEKGNQRLGQNAGERAQAAPRINAREMRRPAVMCMEHHYRVSGVFSSALYPLLSGMTRRNTVSSLNLKENP